MAIIAEWVNLEEESAVSALRGATEKLTASAGEIVLDFVSVRRVDSRVLQAMRDLADKANEKPVKILLSGVNVNLYKVLKLAKLASRFSFVGNDLHRDVTESEGCHAEPSTK